MVTVVSKLNMVTTISLDLWPRDFFFAGLSDGPFKYFETALASLDGSVLLPVLVLPRYLVTAMPSSSEARNLVTVVSRYN